MFLCGSGSIFLFDADPDPTLYFDADPDPIFLFDADLDPTLYFDADPDPIFLFDAVIFDLTVFFYLEWSSAKWSFNWSRELLVMMQEDFKHL